MRKVLLVVTIAGAVLAGACQPGPPTTGGEQGAAPQDVQILVSMKGPGGGNPFWASVEEGARAKAEELGVQLTVLAPPAETDVAAQISQIEDQIAKGVDAIAVAPTDVVGLNPVFESAVANGIPILFVDTKGEFEDALTFIGTDNVFGARLAGEFICENVPQGSKVGLITGVMSHQTGIDRRDGAREALEACGADIVAEQSANWDRAQGQAVMENFLTSHPDLAAAFAGNDLMALGAVEAARAAGVLDQLVIVGFDAIPDAAAAILAGELEATIAQNPFNMGALGVEWALKAVQGEEVPDRIDTGTVLVTEENASEYQ